MNLSTIIDFLLTRYAPVALWVAVAASVGLLVVPLIYLIVRGQIIRRSADGQSTRGRATLWLILSVLMVPVAVVSWASYGGRWWLTREGSRAVLDDELSLQIAVIAGFATALLYMGQVFFLRPRSPLAESISILTGGVRRRTDEMGSAHFTDPAEYRRFNRKHENGLTLLGEFRGEGARPNQYRVLGDLFSLPPEDTARGVIAIGNPGSGKTQSIILPALADAMKDGECLVVTDPQGELRHQVLDYAKVTGHGIIIHDPTDENAARFNLVDGVETVSNARALAEVLLPSDKGNDFWSGAARALLGACMMRYGSIGEIVERLGQLEVLIQDLEREQDDARFLAADFIDAARNAPKQAVGVTSTIMRALDAWADSTVRASTRESDFNALALVKSKRPIVIILSVPSSDRRALAPYLGATLTKLLLDLDSIGERIPGGALPRPVKMILEEFPAMGNMSVIVEQANLVRKRRISFILACQTVGQLQNIYGRDGTATLLAGMATQIIFGGADKETATYFSSLAGNQTKKVEKQPSYQGGPKQVHTVERPLLTHDQIISPPHAPQGNVIIFTRYVTEQYAVNAVILARLTRMYERSDWSSAVTKAASRKPRVLERQLVEKRKRKREEMARTPEPVQEIEVVTPEAEPAVEGGYTFIRRRVIDDSAPPHMQNLVIPYGAEVERT